MRHIECFGDKPSSANNIQETDQKHTKNDEVVAKNTALGHGDM